MNDEIDTPDGRRPAGGSGLAQFAKRVSLVVAVVLGVLLILTATQVLLLMFFAVLFAVMLCSLSGWVGAKTGLSHKWSLLLVTFGMVALLAGVGMLVAPSVGTQLGELQKTLPEAWEKIHERLSKYSWGRQTLEAAEGADDYLPEPGKLMERALGIFSTTAGALSGVLVVLFLGLCLAIEPGAYTGGLVKLFPLPRRERARQVLAALRETLAKWCLAIGASMTIVGVLTGVGLALLGIPLAFTLGLIAALLAFIPNVGPILAAIPAILLAFSMSPTSALHVALLFIGVQTVESYVITPLLERKTVSLPPALTGIVQIALGLSVGMLGVILAAPLTAAGMVLVKKFYVEDALGDRCPAEE